MADPQVDAVAALAEIALQLRVVADELIRLNELLEHEVVPLITPVVVGDVIAVPA